MQTVPPRRLVWQQSTDHLVPSWNKKRIARGCAHPKNITGYTTKVATDWAIFATSTLKTYVYSMCLCACVCACYCLNMGQKVGQRWMVKTNCTPRTHNIIQYIPLMKFTVQVRMYLVCMQAVVATNKLSPASTSWVSSVSPMGPTMELKWSPRRSIRPTHTM